MKTYLKVLGTGLMVLTAFPMVIFFIGLFFYREFSWLAITVHSGTQLLLFTLVYLIMRGIDRMWG